MSNAFSSRPTLARELTRRHFFRDCGVGVGKVALASLLAGELPRVSNAAVNAVAANPMAPHAPHYPAKAKAVIHLFMAGAPSHLDLFDYKPTLAQYEGKPIPPEVIAGQRYAFIRADAAALGPRFKFVKQGQCGAEIAEILPHLGKVVDDICLIRSVHTDQFNHAPAQIFFNTGFGQPGRPSIGSWVTYGLGAETSSLPAFVVMSTGGGISGGPQTGPAAFCPASIPAFGCAIRVIPSSTSPTRRVSMHAPSGIRWNWSNTSIASVSNATVIPKSRRVSQPTRWRFDCKRLLPN